MENAVIYARYSSHNQTENSIEAQVTAAKAFAKGKYNIIRTYADRAKTGTNDNRAAFQEMLSDSNKREFSVVIVWKVDRFGRNREEITINKYHLKKNGVRLEYVAENISSSPEGVILESVLEGFAEYYSKALSQNVKRGLREVASKGGYTGGTCAYGYRIVDGKYEIDPEPAKKIKDVFKMYNEGFCFSEIARTLDLKYYNIHVYLTNIQYTGVYNRTGVNIPGIIPPLIDRETFLIAQEKYNKRTKRRKPDTYILTGKLLCNCGAKYTGANGYYRPTCKCIRKHIKKTDVEGYVTTYIQNIIKDDCNINTLAEKIYEKVNTTPKEDNSSLIKDLTKKRENIIKAVEDGLPYSEVKDRLSEIDEKLQTFDHTPSPREISLKEIKDYIYMTKEYKSIRRVMDGLVSSIIVNPDGLYALKFEAYGLRT